LQRIAANSLIQSVNSLPALLDETILVLHKNIASLTTDQQRLIESVRRTDPDLEGKKILIIDDDIRNIFALTSVFERKNINTVHADNGRDGIKILNKTPDIDVVLVDIMMPEMDGYETIKAIRKITRFKALPIISLTAKAMLGDREKCISAGASDYLSKPVDVEQLFSLLRVWLYEPRGLSKHEKKVHKITANKDATDVIHG
jgi:CheY-like chemotaxis protein